MNTDIIDRKCITTYMKPLLFVSKTIGLAPYQLAGEKIVTSKKLQYISGTLLLSFMISFPTFAALKFFREPNSSETKEQSAYQIFYTLRSIVIAGYTLLSVIDAICSYQKRWDVLQRLTFVDERIDSRRHKLKYVPYFLATQMILSGLTYVLIVHQYVSTYVPPKFYFPYLFLMFGMFLVYYIPMIIELQFINLVYLLNYYFNEIQNNISRLCSREVTIAKTIFVKSSITSLFGHENHEIITMKKKIEKLRRDYENVCDLKEKINAAFSRQLLMTILTLFVEFIYLTFQYLKTHNFGGGNEIDYTVQAAYLIVLLSKMYFLADVCDTTVVKMRSSSKIIHKLYTVAEDEATKEQIRFFSAEMIHINKPFTASGFFNIDRTLLHSIIAAVTTYLIILVQFDSSPRSSKTDSNKTTS